MSIFVKSVIIHPADQTAAHPIGSAQEKAEETRSSGKAGNGETGQTEPVLRYERIFQRVKND